VSLFLYPFHAHVTDDDQGFVYSQTTNRMWRKNRQPPPSGSCVGRDVNRNWPAEWDSNPDGASPDPCDETYRGEAPSDSPENQGLVAYVDKLRDSVGIKLYIDWHSYGQYILSPWGYTCDILPQDNDEHQVLMQKTAAAIKKSKGKTFTYGPSCATLYATTGDSTDYLHGPGKSDYSITIELRDQGAGGFVLPPSQILPSGEEQWEGMKVLLTSM
jgi:murein tripeptide amidase MpaA